MWDRSKYQKFYELKKQSLEGGGQARFDKQHKAGKLTARERLNILFDEGTFVEIGGTIETSAHDFGMDQKKIPGDGVVTGYGKINGRLVFASSEDFTVLGGTLGEAHAKKISVIQDMALEMMSPIIMINDSGGARIEEGVSSLGGYAGIFLRNTAASGVIPQIAVIMGPCAGGACYSPAICDYIFMVQDSGYMFITGPKVVKTVTGEVIALNELGGAKIHTSKSGVAHFLYPDDWTCLEAVRKLLSYLPESTQGQSPIIKGTPIDRSAEIEEIVPQNQSKPYNVCNVIQAIVDQDSFFEVHAQWARNAVVGFGRINGKTVGFVANQPNFMGGSLDCNAADKMARFIRNCDCFNIPLVVLVDTPAFLPGSKQEHDGIIRHGAKLLYAFSEATVPKISLIMRKAYGGAYIAMNSKSMGADIVFAWPIAEIAVMGAEGAVEIIYKKEIANAPECREQLIDNYKNQFLNPYVAAARGYIDEIIEPSDTRKKIAVALQMLANKKCSTVSKKHGNMPV